MAYFVYQILFLGAVVCFTASANLMMEYNWPEPDRNINRFPHESSCHYYYLMLSEEDITIEKCPDGQLFDYVKHNCISEKEHIHCWSRHFGKMKHDHMHMKHKKHFKCPYPWGKYPNLHDCSKYHLCLNGKSRVKKCAHYELFDKISRKCIASIDAVCADKTDVVEHGYVCPKTWGSFTFSKDCSKYYECLQRKPTLRTCQKDKLFDDRLRKCAPKEHVYCGLRHNPYEKVSSEVPEISSVPISVQESTTSNLDITKIPAKEEITSVKSTSQEIGVTSKIPSSSFEEVTLTPQEISSTFKEVTSIPQEASSTFKEVTSIPQVASSAFKEVVSTDQPTSTEISKPSALPEVDNKETKQENSISTADPNAIVIPKQPEKSDVTKNVPEKEEFVKVAVTAEKVQVDVDPQTASDDESEELKKDISTEERDSEDVSITKSFEFLTTELTSSSSATTGCLPEDSMCITERDGTVVKCSNSKDIQPHPKDERRFLDCTGSKINVYSCPVGLTFHPDTKKCKWQFIMG